MALLAGKSRIICKIYLLPSVVLIAHVYCVTDSTTVCLARILRNASQRQVGASMIYRFVICQVFEPAISIPHSFQVVFAPTLLPSSS